MRWLRGAVAIVVGACATPAAATVPDAFGLGARWQGRGGASVALVDDGTAAFVNPAGLVATPRNQLSVGLTGARPAVEAVPSVAWDTNRDGVVDERDAPLDVDVTPPPVFGLDLAVVGRLGGRAALGASVWLPAGPLVRFRTFEPDLPYYARWGNRTQRANASFGLGIDTVGGWKLGVAADLGVAARSTVRLTLDAAASAQTTGTAGPGLGGELVYDVHEIDLEVVPRAAPVVGVQWHLGEVVDALDGAVLAARYHGPTGMPLDVIIDAQANVAVDDVVTDDPFVAALVGVSTLSLFDHDVPQRLDVGVGYVRNEVLAVHVDARWTDWRSLTLNIARVVEAEVRAPLVELGDVVTDGNMVAYEVRSTWGVRGGAELRLPEVDLDGRWRQLAVAVRAGGSFDPTPLLDVGDSALLDSHHSVATTGLGVQTGQPYDDDGTLALDLSLQVHRLARGELPRASEPLRPGSPIGAESLPYGGGWLALGAQLTVGY